VNPDKVVQTLVFAGVARTTRGSEESVSPGSRAGKGYLWLNGDCQRSQGSLAFPSIRSQQFQRSSVVQDDRARLKDLFQEALELNDSERASFVARLLRTDPVLGGDLASLLKAHFANPSFLEHGIHETVQTLLPDGTTPGGRIGPYQIVRELGRGGMGIVYLARRVDGGFEQYVAIKFVRWEVSPEHLRRRADEREILARLQHPGIAPLYGGGVADGRPYLVMEFVDGDTITDFCSDNALSVEARLDLLMEVCDAVQFAHQNLVIHRDLKPSNILVSADGRVKLLDFGIAKLLERESDAGADSSGDTETRTALTPAYSSPEQLQRLPVTTATDVFSLGIVAYEVLTGVRPFDVAGLSPAQVERLICDTDPVPPSAAAAAAGRSDWIDGDLDNVILKALRKEPRERYESARAFADDMKRYLRGLPVTAQTPTRRYRVQKFLRRNRVPVASGVVALTALLSAVGVASWQARVASVRANETALERDNARAATERAETINQFLQGVLATANPSWYIDSNTKGPDVTVLEALEEAARRMDEELADDPEVRGDIHHTLGDTYRALLNHDGMVRHFEASLDLRRQAFEAPHPKIAEALYYVSAARGRSGEWGKSHSLLREAIAMQRLKDEGNNLPFMLHSMQASEYFTGRPAELLPTLLEAKTLFVDRFGPEHRYYRAVVPSLVLLAQAYLDLGDVDAARAWVDSARVYTGGPGSVAAGPVPMALGLVRAFQGSFDEAEALLAGVPAWPAPLTLATVVYTPQRRWAAARSVLVASIDENLGQEPERPPSSRQSVLRLHAGLAYVDALAGETARAARDAQATLDEMDRIFVEGDLPFFWGTRRRATAAIGRSHLAENRADEAEALFLANLEAVQSRGNLGLAWYEANADLAALYDATGDVESRDRHRAVLRGFAFHRPLAGAS